LAAQSFSVMQIVSCHGAKETGCGICFLNQNSAQ